MDEFDTGRERDMPVAAVIKELGRSEREHRAQPLAAGGDDMAGQLRNQRRAAFHFLDDEAVDPSDIVRDDQVHRVE